MFGYKAVFFLFIGVACILLFFYRHYPDRAVADYIEQNVQEIAPGLNLDILDTDLCFPLGLHAGNVRMSWKNQPSLDPVQVELGPVKSVLKLKPLWNRTIQIGFSADIWKGRLTGLATIKDFRFDHLSMDSGFIGLDTQEILSTLKINNLSCKGPVNGTIQTTITNGRVENWKADITAEDIDLQWFKAIPVAGRSSFSTAMISCERTGQGPIRITTGRLTGKQGDIQLSGEIRPAFLFVKSRLDLTVKFFAPSREIKDQGVQKHLNKISDTNLITFILTGTPENPNLELANLPNLLSNTPQPVAKVDRQVQIKNVPTPHLLLKNTLKIDSPDLDLELMGTVVGNGLEPMAIIKKKNGKTERLYIQGETVDRAKIVKIMRRQVVFLVNGKQQLLSMADPDILTEQNPASETGTSDVSKEFTLTKSDVTGMMHNINTLSDQIRVKPHLRKNQTDGYRISSLVKMSLLYEKLGLRQGDIVTEINGLPMDSLNNFAVLYNQLIQDKLDSDIEIQIERNGKSVLLLYRIN
ncbi:type II secretion system protein GspN [uncultured Desulfobacter sp.]|uniref:type II secretion system protein GspN n=1 Tax=uncultured Desulfobacter sp. TaxID=240139 RepID=UPI002AAB25CC|nr:type II secretion system protein GspN [uncultured Desulfobacter sp.]